MFSKTYDAIVVGSGAAGSFAAKELTEQGMEVLLLEAGRAISDEDFDPVKHKASGKTINYWERLRAMMRGQWLQSRAAFFSEQFSHFYVNDIRDPYTTDRDAPYLWIRGQQTGGRLHSFGRVLLRWTDDDFKMKSRTGEGADWPISYADLAPFYSEVEEHLDLYGNRDGVEAMPDGQCMNPAALMPQEDEFKARFEKKRPGTKLVSWRYIAPDPMRVPAPIRAALATGRLTICNNAVARRINTDPATGLATGVEMFDRVSGRVHQAKAGYVLVCGSPIESIRLLLNSKGPKHANGLGNNTDQLGRYFMDQLPILVMGSYPDGPGWGVDQSAPPDPFYNTSGGLLIPRFEGQDKNDFMFQGSIGRYVVPDGAAASLSFFGFGAMRPDKNNTVTLHPRRKDKTGRPVPHIRCKMGQADIQALQQHQDLAATMLTDAGADIAFIGSPLGLTEMGRGAFPDVDPFSRFLFRTWFPKTMVMGSAIHESGGARMGTTPEVSVLNDLNQIWDAQNVLVTDAAAFPTAGTVGTTLTLMALTVRACRNLAQSSN